MEELRHEHVVRVLSLPAHGSQRLVVRAEDYASALQLQGQRDKLTEMLAVRATVPQRDGPSERRGGGRLRRGAQRLRCPHL